MNCPFFDDASVGLCFAPERPYAPTLERMETYCVRTRFPDCPIYAFQESGEVVGRQADLIEPGTFIR